MLVDISTNSKILLNSHYDFSLRICPDPSTKVAFSLTRNACLSREDVNLHGGSGKVKEKVYGCLQAQH